MRFVVLLFGLLATVVTAGMGYTFLKLGDILAELHKNNIDQLDFIFRSADADPARTGLFLLIGAGFCLFGTILGFCRCGWQGGLLMFVTAVGPAVVNPMTLVGTAPQIFAALLSCLVRPLPLVPVSQED